MNSSSPAEVAAELRRLAEDHEARRKGRRWRLRGWGWGILALFWLVTLLEPDDDLITGTLVLTLIVGGFVEAALRIAYRFDARAAAAVSDQARGERGRIGRRARGLRLRAKGLGLGPPTPYAAPPADRPLTPAAPADNRQATRPTR